MKRKVGLLAFMVSGIIVVAASGQETDHSFGKPNVLQWALSRTYHVENYKLKLRFDQLKGEVFGDETVKLRPIQPHFHKFYLNSSELTIDSVTIERAQGTPVKLTYTSQDPRLWITLDHDYAQASTLRVRIVYHGFPRTGLFFVNPTPSYPNWPHQIFSQGEAELNHFWFPCWDYPNDMATSETITTVPEGEVVVSNGKLVKVTRAAGQVTYDWVESIPHSSYLISLAIGPWRKFTDKYEGKPVDYYVASSVDEATARRSFHLTPDMIAFFSRATGVDYPYEQYAQTAVQNFLFGGQENVSATTLTDRTLHDERADQDYPSTNLVSHELGQHWFGDYVQGRDWANIWLNEGFATYMEGLYTQHHDGYDAYRFAIYNDQLAEQEEDRNSYRRPIVDRHYSDPFDMFDATTHEKGAAVLDMLRYLIDGAEATSHPASQLELFFQALHHYLVAHHAQDADTPELIKSIRETTGEELGWFFREWVFMAGHPDYRVVASYDATKKTEKVTVTQTQRTDAETPIFDMPIELAFYGADAERKKIQVRDNLQQQEFEIPLDFEPRWVDFDPDGFIDKTVQFDKAVDALIAEAERDPSMMSRLWATQRLGTTTLANPDARVEALAQVMGNDGFYGVRAAAATSLGSIGTEQAKLVLLSALQQPDSRVRTAVFESLGKYAKDQTVYSALVNALHNDSSYAVEAAAAKGLGKSGIAEAFDVLQAEVLTKPEIHVMQATLGGLVANKNPKAVEILLAQARPGVPERIRLSALVGLESLKEVVTPSQVPELTEVVRAALHDPYYLTQEAGEELVGVFHLSQFEADIQTEAQRAPMAMQRDPARKVLEQLHHYK
ncbi:MAG TPA: M1 family metallopeptidase [Candidatus Aquilonibacter sp.]|nr:M1 family metallopeptidase [Candidatus Aquilonibacter sp.]